MASSTDPEVGKVAIPPKSPVKSNAAPPPTAAVNCFVVDAALRVLLFSATLVAVILTVTSQESELVSVPQLPIRVKRPAKFTHSPAFIYFVAALAVACFYSIISALASISAIFKPAFSTKFLLHFALLDVVMLGLVASATGAAGGVAYIGLKGNDHVLWMKVCSTYGKFCRHVGSSTALALFAAILLVLLSMLSTYSLYKRSRH